MKLFKKILLVIMTVFLLNGCNVYREMVIPTPYYPENQTTNSNTLGQDVNEVQQNQIPQQPQQQIPQTTTPQPLPTEKIKTVTESPIKTENKTFVKRIPFPEAEYASLPKTGSASINGYIYAIAPNGKKIYAKETRLYLNPVTSYSTQWYKESYLGGAKMSKVDSRLFNYLKFTTSDSNGKYEFFNIPTGSYYLIGVIKCGQECGYNSVKNIRVTEKVSVIGNENKRVDLVKNLQ